MLVSCIGDRQDGVVAAKAAARRLQVSGSLWARLESVTQGEWRANLCTDLVQVETAKMELLLPRLLQGGYRAVGRSGQGRRAYHR